METKTSEQWWPIIQKEFIEEQEREIIIYDPDGWDRGNWQFTWYEEQITHDEFHKRLCSSTIMSTKVDKK